MSFSKSSNCDSILIHILLLSPEIFECEIILGLNLLTTFGCCPLDSEVFDTAAADPAHLIFIVDIVDDP